MKRSVALAIIGLLLLSSLLLTVKFASAGTLMHSEDFESGAAADFWSWETAPFDTSGTISTTAQYVHSGTHGAYFSGPYTNYLNCESTPNSAEKQTFTIWAKFSDTATDPNLGTSIIDAFWDSDYTYANLGTDGNNHINLSLIDSNADSHGEALVSRNTWHNITMTVLLTEGASIVDSALYLDGTQVGTSSVTLGSPTATDSFSIEVSVFAYSGYVAMDDIKHYSGSTLVNSVDLECGGWGADWTKGVSPKSGYVVSDTADYIHSGDYGAYFAHYDDGSTSNNMYYKPATLSPTVENSLANARVFTVWAKFSATSSDPTAFNSNPANFFVFWLTDAMTGFAISSPNANNQLTIDTFDTASSIPLQRDTWLNCTAAFYFTSNTDPESMEEQPYILHALFYVNGVADGAREIPRTEAQVSTPTAGNVYLYNFNWADGYVAVDDFKETIGGDSGSTPTPTPTATPTSTPHSGTVSGSSGTHKSTSTPTVAPSETDAGILGFLALVPWWLWAIIAGCIVVAILIVVQAKTDHP
ncbi:Uncharacterised protein [uncultured archaeon]|nr:Uncharacterised protein [uncultured archaeon]